MSPVRTTIAAIATPQGRGGIGVIRLSGRNLLPLAGQVSGGRQPRPRHALWRRWRATASGALSDDQRGRALGQLGARMGAAPWALGTCAIDR